MRAIGIWCIIQLLISWSVGGNFDNYYTSQAGWLGGWFIGAVLGDFGTLLIGGLNAHSGAVVVIAVLMKLGLIGAAFTRTSRELLDLAPWLIVGQFVLALYVIWVEPYMSLSFIGDSLGDQATAGSGWRIAGRTVNFGGKIPVTVILGIGCLLYLGAASSARERLFGSKTGT